MCKSGDFGVYRNGLIPIEQLEPPQAGDGFSEQIVGIQSTDGCRLTSHFYDGGIKPIMRVRTRMGYELEATHIHPVLTLAKNGCKYWMQMHTLKMGDYVAIQRHGTVWGNITQLPDFEITRVTNTVIPNLPREMTPDLAYVMGVIVGDGGMTDKNPSVMITSADDEIVNAVSEWCSQLGLKLRLQTSNPAVQRYGYRISSVLLKRWLNKLGIENVNAHHKEVPFTILQSTQENVRAFLQGLFDTDGSATKFGVEFCSVSKKLAHQVHLLLLQFGIISKLRFKPNRYAGSWTIQLLGDNARLFYDIVGFRLTRKQARRNLLPIESNNNLDVIPYLPAIDPFKIPHDHRWDRRYLKGTRMASYKKLQKIAVFVPEVNELLEPEYYWDEIIEVTQAGKAHVYDLTVPETHAFVANGIVSHNSTMLLQVSGTIANEVGTVLYVSGEESAAQIKMRAERLSIEAPDLFLLTETNLGQIIEQVNRVNPTVLIVDSIQTMYADDLESSPGNVSQVRECAGRLQGLAKSSGVSVFLVGHVTKEGSIAGPKVLEHIVDTVLYLEGDPFQTFRLLRSVKNRFGATSEVGVFEMSGAGMVEVPNPSEAFLAERVVNAPGSAIAVTMEGTRPLLVELQALTSPTAFGNPRRTPNGVDMNRLLLVSAVLSKRVGLRLHEQDIFVNVVGGMKIDEPASDLAMAVAMASSYYDKPIAADLTFIGEVGLSGELRAVGQLSARLNEAAKLGFKRAVVPKMRRKVEGVPSGLKLIEVRNIAEALAVAVPRE
ncbi:MAG: DNA repair protein RadA [Anaerolineae bacterium]